MTTASLRQCLAASTMVLLLLVSTAFGQTPGTGAISGMVYDPANRVVANAEVLAVNEATHVSRSVTDDVGGCVSRAPAAAGNLHRHREAAGFAANTSRSIQVTVSETTSLNVTLAVATANESVQVEGSVGDSRTGKLDAGRTGGRNGDPVAAAVEPQLYADPGPRAGRGGGPADRDRAGKRNAERRLQWRDADGEQHPVQWHRRQQPVRKLGRQLPKAPMWAQPFRRRIRSRSSACRRPTSMRHTDAERERTSTWSARAEPTTSTEAHGSLCATTSSTPMTSFRSSMASRGRI